MQSELMTDLEQAVIAAIHTEPKYRFLYDEAKLAKKMEQKGWLQSIGNKMYSVTRKGENAYSLKYKTEP